MTTLLSDQLSAVDTTQDSKSVGPLGEGIWIGIIGPKRTGKGLLGTNMCLQAALLGVEVFHFGNLNFGTKIDDALELLERDPDALRNSLIFFDEAKAHAMSSRQSSTVMLLFENLMTQSGHFNVSVIWTTTSQSGLHRVFKEQTQWMYWIDHRGVKKEKIFDNRPAGMPLDEGWKQKLTNKCEGWCVEGVDDHMPQFKHRKEHQGPPGLIDCRDAMVNIESKLVAGKHGVSYLMVSQESSPHGAAGKRERGHFRCAQRFYNLAHTDAFVSALTMATTMADDVREASKGRTDQEMLEAALRRLIGVGIREAYAAEVSEAIKGDFGVRIPVNRLGVLMNACGVQRTRRSSRGKADRTSTYDLASYVEKLDDTRFRLRGADTAADDEPEDIDATLSAING